MLFRSRFYGPQDINQLVISTSEKSYVDQGMSAHDFNIVKLFYENVERIPDIRQIFTQRPTENFTKISINFANHIDLKKVATTLDGYLPPSLIMENSGFNTDLIGNAAATKQNALSLLQSHFNLKGNESSYYHHIVRCPNKSNYSQKWVNLPDRKSTRLNSSHWS